MHSSLNGKFKNQFSLHFQVYIKERISGKNKIPDDLQTDGSVIQPKTI